jgi:hypothetical protein
VKPTILGIIFNKHLSKGRCLVENSLEILKKTFKKLLLLNNNFSIWFIPDVVTCYMFYNLILNGKDVDVDTLMQQVEQKI